MTDSRSPGASGAREGKEETWLFLRTLVGLLLVGWLLAALFSPPRPLSFLVVVAPLWLLAAVGAWWLHARDGYARLRASPLYAPGLSAARALGIFVLMAAALKFGGTFLLDALVESQSGYVAVAPGETVPSGKTAVSDRPLFYDLAVSAVALAAASLAVYRGWLAWLASDG
ncbi:MAG: hypothetical protein V5A23_02150 [Halobacteriales archaeon]